MYTDQHEIPQDKADESQSGGKSESLEVPHRHHSNFYLELRKAQQNQKPRYSDAHIKQMMDLRFA